MNAPIHTGLALSDKVRPAHILQTINEGIDAAAQSGEPAWSGAVDALVLECVQLGVCFSSGEISAWIRTYRPDLRFSVTQNIGPYLRGLYSGGNLPDYTSGPVEQKARTTAGYSQARLNTQVFIYGPDSFAMTTHRFEVRVPTPGGAMPDLTSLPPAPVQPATPVQIVPIKIPGKSTKSAGKPVVGRKVLNFTGTCTATVHTDSRLCVPRRAFEALATRQQRTVRGGDDVYVTTTGDDIVISLTPLTGAQKYALVTSRCRLLFTSRSGTPFAVSNHYAVTITDGGLKLDMSSPL